jgi:DNA-binding PadR family transcriptional regulator
MLSKTNTLLLGVIAEKPINPYEITKLMEYISAGDWLSLAASSIYAAIKVLQDKGFITGKNVREGNMPEKTMYSITAEGKKQLLIAIEDFLGNTEWDYAKSNIAAILICHISKKRVLEILSEKEQKLIQKKDVLQVKLKELKSTVPHNGLHAIKHMLYLTNAEIKSSREFIASVEADMEWNHFLGL